MFSYISNDWQSFFIIQPQALISQEPWPCQKRDKNTLMGIQGPPKHTGTWVWRSNWQPVLAGIQLCNARGLSSLLGSTGKMLDACAREDQTHRRPRHIFSNFLILLLWSDQRQKPDTTNSSKPKHSPRTRILLFTSALAPHQHQLLSNILPLLRKPYCTWSSKEKEFWVENTSPSSQG